MMPLTKKGLGMAGLNFVGNAVYAEPVSDKENVAQFEFIPWILSQCATLEEARQKLSSMNLTNTQFNENFPCAPASLDSCRHIRMHRC